MDRVKALEAVVEGAKDFFKCSSSADGNKCLYDCNKEPCSYDELADVLATLGRGGRGEVSKCALCGQRNVDGAIDQHGDFVCVDCFTTGEAKFSGRKAKIMAPVPGYDYSGIDHRKILKAWNGERAGDSNG